VTSLKVIGCLRDRVSAFLWCLGIPLLVFVLVVAYIVYIVSDAATRLS